MRHNVFGKTLNRDTGQRQALLRGLAGAIIRSEAIETTEAKAKAAKGLIEKLITQARRASLSDIRQIESVIVNKDLVDKLVNDIATRFKTRQGGYLRLVKIGIRTGDNAPMVRMEFVSKANPPLSSPVQEKAPTSNVKSSSNPEFKQTKTSIKKVASRSKAKNPPKAPKNTSK